MKLSVSLESEDPYFHMFSVCLWEVANLGRPRGIQKGTTSEKGGDPIWFTLIVAWFTL